MDFLVVRMMAALRERGDALLSLSLSALARVPDAAEAAAMPAAVTTASLGEDTGVEETTRRILMEVLARYYDFKGLFDWKKKFDPDFEDRYLVFSDPLALPRVAHALIRVQSPAGIS